MRKLVEATVHLAAIGTSNETNNREGRLKTTSHLREMKMDAVE